LPSEEAEAVAAEEVAAVLHEAEAAVLHDLHPQDLPLHEEAAPFPDAVLP
tara:strand:+ start:1754 stop:1903 length:150 start_codon:yes stop_codon:yes gene_type:complete